MASHAAAAAAAATRTNSLSRIFSSSSSPTVKPPPKHKPKIKRSPSSKPPAADAAEPDGDHKLPKPLRAILKGLLGQRHPDTTVSLPSRFRDQERVYEIAVRSLASYARQQGTEATIDALRPFLGTSTEGFATLLIRLHGRASMPSQAAATFLELPAQHQSTMTFNAVLAAYGDAREFDALVVAFQEILASHPWVAPNVLSYNQLIRALCQKPDLSAALDTVPLMEKRGISPDSLSFYTILSVFYNHGRVDDAETVWDMMKQRNFEPDVRCYNAKLRGLVAEGRIEDALAVVVRLERDGPKPDTVSYNELIRGYCKAERLQDAKKLYDYMIKNESRPNKGTYETLLPHLLQAGELDCALRYCHELLSVSGKLRCRVASGLLQDVVDALVEASRVEEATDLVELGRNRGLRIPHTTEDTELGAETDEKEPISEENKAGGKGFMFRFSLSSGQRDKSE